MLMTTGLVIYFITSKNQIILWHIFLLLTAELTHAVCDNRLHKNQFSKICSSYCEINNINLFAFYKISNNCILLG